MSFKRVLEEFGVAHYEYALNTYGIKNVENFKKLSRRDCDYIEVIRLLEVAILHQHDREQYFSEMLEYGVDSVDDVKHVTQKDFEIMKFKVFHGKKCRSRAIVWISEIEKAVSRYNDNLPKPKNLPKNNTSVDWKFAEFFPNSKYIKAL